MMGMILMKKMIGARWLVIGDIGDSLEKLGIEKMTLLSLEAMRGEMSGGIRIEKIVI